MRKKGRELKTLLPLNFTDRSTPTGTFLLSKPALSQRTILQMVPDAIAFFHISTETIPDPATSIPMASSGPKEKVLQPHFGHQTRLQKALTECQRVSSQSCVCTSSALREAGVPQMLKDLRLSIEHKEILNVCDISNHCRLGPTALARK